MKITLKKPGKRSETLYGYRRVLILGLSEVVAVPQRDDDPVLRIFYTRGGWALAPELAETFEELEIEEEFSLH